VRLGGGTGPQWGRTKTPYADKHDPADAGKNVYSLLRWQNTKGETGPWSDVITVKLPA
jgi:hypothetical protein